MAYHSLREHVALLEERGLLARISGAVNKDTELMPFCRWQFRGLPADECRAFLFEHVVDSRGRTYESPVLVGALAASRRVLAVGMQTEPEAIEGRWSEALRNLIPPREVPEGPAQEEVHTGTDLERPGGGFDAFPIPISTPGFDNAPFFTLACWVTRDPETGAYNVGNYRAQVKSPNRTGCFTHPTQHIATHWRKCREAGVPLEAALVVGAGPVVGYASVTKVPYGVDEFAVAGALAGEPVSLVRCRTVDLLVPADAEMVFEGRVSTTHLEPEAPFGEYTGYMGGRTLSPFFELTAVTHRRRPIFQALLSQHTPCEASVMHNTARESVYLKFLRYDCNIPAVREVVFMETGGNWQYMVIRMEKQNPVQPWQALHAAVAYDAAVGKIVVAVDEDIDARDPNMVNWALSYRMQPERDLRLTGGKAGMLDPSIVDPALPYQAGNVFGGSAVLIDATRKWGYLPVSLPARPYMERARQLWEAAGLPPLAPRNPWFGYELGYWPDELREEADLAVRGEYFVNGEKAARQRKTVEESGGMAGWL